MSPVKASPSGWWKQRHLPDCTGLRLRISPSFLPGLRLCQVPRGEESGPEVVSNTEHRCFVVVGFRLDEARKTREVAIDALGGMTETR